MAGNARRVDMEAVQPPTTQSPTSPRTRSSNAAQLRRQAGNIAALLTQIATCQQTAGLEGTGQAASPKLLNLQVALSQETRLALRLSAYDADATLCIPRSRQSKCCLCKSARSDFGFEQVTHISTSNEINTVRLENAGMSQEDFCKAELFVKFSALCTFTVK